MKLPVLPPLPQPALTVLLAAWLATAGNIALWKQLWELPEVGGTRGWAFTLGFGVWVAAVLTLCLSLLAWPRVFKPLGVLLLLSAASATHFMLQYTIVIDSSMLMNVMQTDTREAADLLSGSLVVTLLLVGVLPAWWLWRQPVTPMRWPRRAWTNAATAGLALLVAAAALYLIFQDFASVMRNHKQVRYLLNPLNSVYALGRLAADSVPRAQQPLQAVGTDARPGAAAGSAQTAPLFVLVVGETARAANFSLGGYARETTPRLQALAREGQLAWFGNVRSCGTNTQASVPCMFSHHGKEAHESSQGRHENLLDVLQRAGLAVLWLDNQSGCKGVCDRVPNVDTRDLTDPVLCAQGECLDEIMLQGLEGRISQLPAERRAQGVVVVMHQMGSHGPAYFKRSPPAQKVFQPECTSKALQDCTRDALVNTYDNSIRYTDHFLAETVAWLKRQPGPTALLYVSDHGESLGENNLYLHGLPYALAPVEQKHVPWVTWVSTGLRERRGLDMACLGARSGEPLTHDHLFHSVLGLLDVRTEAYRPALDAFGPCTPRPH